MQNSRYPFAAACALAALVAGCGSSLSPMDSAQKDRFRTTLGHLASVTNVLVSSGSVRSSTRDREQVSAVLRALGNLEESRSAASDETQALQKALRDALHSGTCLAKSNMSTTVGSSSLKEPIHVEIAGDNCPVAFQLNVTGMLSKTDMDLAYEVDYSVKSDDFRKLGDIDGLTLKGTFKGSSPDNKTGSVQLNMTGALHSRTEKDLGFYVNAGLAVARQRDTANMTGEIAFGVQFGDFTGELKVKGTVSDASSTKDAHYYVNEQEVSADEFQSYLKDFKFNGKMIGSR